MMKSSDNISSAASHSSSLFNPSALWSVNASLFPVLSAMRLLALPVGAVNKIFSSPSFSLMYNRTRCTVVLPVPGPPVIILTRFVNAFFTASTCLSDNNSFKSFCACVIRSSSPAGGIYVCTRSVARSFAACVSK